MSIVDNAAIAIIISLVAWLGGFLGVRFCWSQVRKELISFFSTVKFGDK